MKLMKLIPFLLLLTSASFGATSQVGINPLEINDYCTAAPFGNLTSLCRFPWGKPNAPYDNNPQTNPITYDANGWPTSDAGTLTFALGYPKGTYAASWLGKGTVTFAVSGKAVTQTNLTQTADGVTHCTLALDPPTWRAAGVNGADGWFFSIAVTGQDASNHIRQIQVLAPGYDPSTGPFRPEFLASLQPFACIRTICLQQINSQTDTPLNWADRAKPTDPLWTNVKGLPFEAIVSLFNSLGKDGWVCVPDTATDDYLNGMAAFFAANLRPDVNLYVEYSNELWNSGFRQAGRILAASAVNKDLTETGTYGLAMQQIAYKGKWAGEAFKAAFTKAGKDPSRVRPVLCGQAANSFWSMKGLEYIAEKYGPPSNYFYAVGFAPYLSLYDDDARMNATTLDALFVNLQAQSIKNPLAWITANAALAKQYNLGVVAYECGQGLIPKQQPQPANYPALTSAAQDDSRMADLYRWYAANWPGSLWCHFGDVGPKGDPGYWGMKEYADSAPSVKWNVVRSLATIGNGSTVLPPVTTPIVTTPVVTPPVTTPVVTVPVKPVTKPSTRGDMPVLRVELRADGTYRVFPSSATRPDVP